MHLGSLTAVKAIYDTESTPNPVTGKRVKLIVDRYAFASGGRVAVVDLGTAASATVFQPNPLRAT